MAALQVGDEAPDFEIPAVVDNIKQQFRLSDYRGTPTCSRCLDVR